MNAVAQSAPLTHLGWSLIHFLWQGAFVGLGYFCLRRLLRHAAPQARYILALGTLLILALLPLCTFFYLGGWHGHQPDPAAVLPAQAVVMTAGVGSPVLSALPLQPASPYLSWVVWLWLAGVAFMGTRALWGWNQAGKLRSVQTLSAHPWQALLSALQDKMQIQQAIQLFESARVQAPLVIGWLKPAILIPPSAVCRLDWRQAEMILAHELAHIRRHDYLFNALQVLIETLLFYHPLVHWISGDARNEREFCCDDAAMQTCGDRLGYLKALAELEQHRLHVSAALAASGGALLNRAYRLAYPNEPIGRLPAWSATLALLAAFFAGILLIDPRPMPAHTATHASAMAQPAAISKISAPANRNLQVAAAHASPLRAIPAPTQFKPPVAEVRFVQPLITPLFAQAITLQAVAPPHRLTAISKPVFSGITLVAPHPLPQPEYPYPALREGLGGTVRVAFRISAHGQVTDIRTSMISGPALLASAARAALEAWKFNPVRINGATLTPQINLRFVFSADTKPVGACTLVTGSHVCHWYRISLRHVLLEQPGGSSGVPAKESTTVKLAVVGNTEGELCRPQDTCFFSGSHPGWGHEQRIDEQFRMLSQGLIPAVSSS